MLNYPYPQMHEYASRVFNRKTLDLAGVHSKASEHRICTQGPAAFLHADNTFSEKETRETHQSQ